MPAALSLDERLARAQIELARKTTWADGVQAWAAVAIAQAQAQIQKARAQAQSAADTLELITNKVTELEALYAIALEKRERERIQGLEYLQQKQAREIAEREAREAAVALANAGVPAFLERDWAQEARNAVASCGSTVQPMGPPETSQPEPSAPAADFWAAVDAEREQKHRKRAGLE